METEKQTKNKKIILIIGIVLVVVVACTSCLLLFNKEVYRLVKVNSFVGTVSVERKETLDAFEGMQLIPKDVVSVFEDSSLELLADSDKHIMAEENTKFVLHTKGNEEKGNITIDLLEGEALFTIDNKLNEDSGFEVVTPNATLSVRGTTFEVKYDTENTETFVAVTEGKVLAKYGCEEMLIEEGNQYRIVGSGDDIELKEPLTPIFTVSYYYSFGKDYYIAMEKFEPKKTMHIHTDVNWPTELITIHDGLDFGSNGNIYRCIGCYEDGKPKEENITSNPCLSPLSRTGYDMVEVIYPHEEYLEGCDMYDKIDVSDWFPETYKIKTEDGIYECVFEKVEEESLYCRTDRAGNVEKEFTYKDARFTFYGKVNKK